MKTRKIQIAFIALMFVGAVSNQMFAQKGETSFGAAGSIILPQGAFSKQSNDVPSVGFNQYTEITHSTGWGISAIGKYGLSDFLTVVGTLGWYSVPETIKLYEMTYPEESKMAFAKTNPSHVIAEEDGTYSFVDISAGLRANISFLYVEARAGYFSGDQGGFGFIPAVGAEYKNFDFQANYVIVGDGSHLGFRIGYYFL